MASTRTNMASTRTNMARWATTSVGPYSLAIFAAAGVTGATSAHAQGFACASGTNAADLRDWRADVSAIAGAFPNVSTEEAEYALLLAFSEWNEGAAGVPLRYLGSTTCNGSEPSGPCCSSNILTVGACAAGTIGVTTARCGGTKSLVRLCTTFGGTLDVDAIAAGETDAVGVITHEVGHSIGLDHPSANPANPAMFPVMRAAIGPGSRNLRQLYRYDVVCSEDAPPVARKLDAYGAYWDFVTGAFGAEFMLGDLADFANRWSIDYPLDATGRMSHVSKEGANFVYRRGGSTYQKTFSGNGAGGGAALHYAAGEVSPWRLYYNLALTSDAGYLTDTELHRVQVRSSGDEFGTSVVTSLFECSSPSGFETCPFFSWAGIFSGEAVDTAFDEFSGRSVLVWSEQTRTAATNFRLRVAIGEASPSVVSPSAVVPGAFTHARPAVACEPFAASGPDGREYDCIVAYSDANTPDGRIRVRRFFGEAGTTQWGPDWDPGTTTVDATDAESAFGVEAWFVSGWWYLAFLNTDTIGGELETLVFRSSDSLVWARVAGTLPYSTLTPSAAVEPSSPPLVLLNLAHD